MMQVASFCTLIVAVVSGITAVITQSSRLEELYGKRFDLFPGYFLQRRITEDILFNSTGLVVFEDLLADLSRVAQHERGIWLLWAPPHSGKSTILRQVAAKIQSQKSTVDVVLFRPPSDISSVPLSVWFNRALNLGTYNGDLASLLKPDRRLVIMIDQVDIDLGELLGVIKDWEAFSVFLATNSFNSQGRFVVIFAIRDPSLAKEMTRWNGGFKFRLVNPESSK